MWKNQPARNINIVWTKSTPLRVHPGLFLRRGPILVNLNEMFFAIIPSAIEPSTFSTYSTMTTSLVSPYSAPLAYMIPDANINPYVANPSTMYTHYPYYYSSYSTYFMFIYDTRKFIGGPCTQNTFHSSRVFG